MKHHLSLFPACVFACLAALLVVLIVHPAPPAQAAPALQFTCTLAPRLTIGGQGQVTPGQANNVRDIPARAGSKVGEIPAGAVFTVLDGPVCADDFNWWQVDYQGLVGWTVEGSGIDYFIEPIAAESTDATSLPDVTATPVATPTPSPEPIEPVAYPLTVDNPLEVGASARMDADSLRMREEPNMNARVVSTVPADEIVEIVGERQEADGFTWWQIRRPGGTVGWVVERYEENARHIQTLFPLCPHTTDRISFVVHPYLYTAAPDGSARCVLAQLQTSRLYTTWSYMKYAVNEGFWSPDGQELMFMVGGLYKISVDGAVRTPLMTQGGVEWASWSPDGTRIALVMNGQAWVINRDGSRSVRLSQAEEDVEYVGWFPDSQRVFYLESIPDNPNAIQTSTRTTYHFHTVGIDLSQPRKIHTLDGQQEMRDIALSPDGRSVIAVITQLDEYEAPDSIATRMIDLDTFEYTQISPTWANWIWSPDGTQLAIADDVENRIWSPATDEKILLDDFSPTAWSTDGTTLFESTWDDDAHGFRVYDIETSEIEAYLEEETAGLRADFGEGIQSINVPVGPLDQ